MREAEWCVVVGGSEWPVDDYYSVGIRSSWSQALLRLQMPCFQDRPAT